jgi:peroxiredoxin
MKKIQAGLFFAGILSAGPALAALSPGDPAPDFTLQAAVGGKEFIFSLAEARKQGPVVVYFYPKSFTRGCTIEAHEFADAAASFAEAKATLIGISADPIETQKDFSTKECRDKFPVAADPTLSVIRAFDVVRTNSGDAASAMSDRVSFVISPDGRIIYAYSDRLPDKHIENTLGVVRQWQEQHGALKP